MKRFVLFDLLIIFVGAFLVGCGVGKPDVVVKRFSDALVVYDLDVMDECVTGRKMVEFDLSKDDNIILKEMYDFITEELSNTTYEIKNVEIGEKTGSVTVEYTVSDVTPVLEDAYDDYMHQSVSSYFLGENDADDKALTKILKQCINDSCKTEEPGQVTIDITYKCVVKDKEWKIESVTDEKAFINVISCNLSYAIDTVGDEDDEFSDSEERNELGIENKFNNSSDSDTVAVQEKTSDVGNTDYDYEALKYAGHYEGFGGYAIDFTAFSSVEDDEIGVADIYYEGERVETVNIYLCSSPNDWTGYNYDALYEIRCDGYKEYFGFYEDDGILTLDYNGSEKNYDILEMKTHFKS